MCQQLRSTGKPTAASSSKYCPQHVAPSLHLQIQLGSHSFAHNSCAVLSHLNLAMYITDDCAWKTSFATRALLVAFRSTILHWLAFSILVQFVPMVLHTAKDKLNVRIVILAKSFCVFQSCSQQSLGCKVSLIDRTFCISSPLIVLWYLAIRIWTGTEINVALGMQPRLAVGVVEWTIMRRIGMLRLQDINMPQ